MRLSIHSRVSAGVFLCVLAAGIPAGLRRSLADGPKSFPIWDERAAFPAAKDLTFVDGAADVVVHRGDSEWSFLHDNAVVWHGGELLAAWYNCPSREMVGASAIRGRRSKDAGRTWGPVEVIAADRDRKGILYVPVSLLSHGGVLHAFVSNMTGPDLVTRCEAFVHDPRAGAWVSRGFIAGPFLPNCAPLKMDDGNFIMAGRVSDRPGAKPETPAVAISEGAKLTSPWTVIRLGDRKLPPFPETTLWAQGRSLTAIARGGHVFASDDFGRTWTGPARANLPMESSKLYACTLSTHQRYLIWNVPGQSAPRRSLLVIAVSRPGERTLSAAWKIRDGHSDKLDAGPEWSYPCAVEHEGRLYVIYTSQKRNSVMTVLPVKSLAQRAAP